MNTDLSITKQKKNIFYTFSIKQHILPIIFVSFTISLILFSSNNLYAAKNGLKLWANNVVPALLPFFIAVELLSYTDVCQKISMIFSRFMRPIFNVPRKWCICIYFRNHKWLSYRCKNSYKFSK